MGALTRNQTLDILEKRRYSGVISAHTWASPLNYPRIYKLGGVVTPAAGSQGAASFVKRVGGLPQAARQALLLRLRLRLGHQRPGGAGLAARQAAGVPVHRARRQDEDGPPGHRRAHLRLQQGRRGPLRPVRRLAGRPAPHRRRTDGARDEPRRRGLPADVGARRGRQADHLPQRHGRGHLAAAAGTRPAGRARLRPAAPRRPAHRAARGLLPLVRQAQQGRRHRGVQQPLARRPGDHDRPAPPLGQGRAPARARGRCADARSGSPRACTWAGA